MATPRRLFYANLEIFYYTNVIINSQTKTKVYNSQSNPHLKYTTHYSYHNNKLAHSLQGISVLCSKK